MTGRGPKFDLERAKAMAEMWNNPPYPTLREIGERFGMTRQAVKQILACAAVRYGVPVLSAEERALARAAMQVQAIEASRPRCKVCGVPIKRNTKYGYCTAHFLQSPEWRARHNANVRDRYRRMKEELQRLREEVARLKGEGA